MAERCRTFSSKGRAKTQSCVRSNQNSSGAGGGWEMEMFSFLTEHALGFNFQRSDLDSLALGWPKPSADPTTPWPLNPALQPCERLRKSRSSTHCTCHHFLLCYHLQSAELHLLPRFSIITRWDKFVSLPNAPGIPKYTELYMPWNVPKAARYKAPVPTNDAVTSRNMGLVWLPKITGALG